MAKSTNTRYETLAAALAIIDPDGILSPGTAEHNAITETILSWMHEMQPAEVLRMSADARHTIRFKPCFWQPSRNRPQFNVLEFDSQVRTRWVHWEGHVTKQVAVRRRPPCVS